MLYDCRILFDELESFSTPWKLFGNGKTSECLAVYGDKIRSKSFLSIRDDLSISALPDNGVFWVSLFARYFRVFSLFSRFKTVQNYRAIYSVAII